MLSPNTIDQTEPSARGSRPPSAKPRRKILLVDTNHATFARLHLILKETAPEQYTVDWADRFRLGVAQMRRKKYDLCLVADRLGYRSGHEFIETTQQLRPEIPLIMLEQGEQESEPMNEPVWDAINLDRLHPQMLCDSLREACVTRARH